MFYKVSLFVLLFTVSTLFSQEIIFPGVYGSTLKSKLVQAYKTSNTLGYSSARDKMYGEIDNKNNKVTCVYTGYQVTVPYQASNPRSYTNGASPIMNCEHTWPQSKGASGQAKSDMHHLFATNGDVNGARGSLPFGEIDDNKTDKWFIGTSSQTSIPSSNKDAYSELDTNTRFEVPEKHKGNVARAMFYFYTMYENQADHSFFTVQKEVLRKWNSMDPPDADEIARTEKIAAYQGGKINPFVKDTTLIGRVYFGVTTDIKKYKKQVPAQFKLISNYPNPFNGHTTIKYYLQKSGPVKLLIFNSAGQTVKALSFMHETSGEGSININLDQLNSGIYYYRLISNAGSIAHKMVMIK